MDYCEVNKEIAFKINTEFPTLVSKLSNQLTKIILLSIFLLIKFMMETVHIKKLANPLNQYSITNMR